MEIKHKFSSFKKIKWFSDCTILVTYSIFWRSSKCLEVWIIQQLFTLQTLQGDFLHNLFLTFHFLFILWISVTNPKSKIWEKLVLIEHKTKTVISKLQNEIVKLCWCTITERQVKGVYQFDYCNSVITRSSESTGKPPRYNGQCYIHKIFNSFTYVNKCPTHRHFVWDISQCI